MTINKMLIKTIIELWLHIASLQGSAITEINHK